MRKQFTALIEKVDKVNDIPSGNAFLHAVQQHFDAQNVSYVCLNLPNPTHDKYYVQHTFSPEWEQYYINENCFNVDPVLRHALTNVIPTDWSQFKNLSKSEKAFLTAAQKHGIGRQGLTFTVRGSLGEVGVFSINTDHNKSDWAAYKNIYLSDQQMIATYFHEKILRSQEKFRPTGTDILSARELECLKWCTAGKSYWETSVILGIAERTVHFHMTTVRQKLNAITNAQAVANAIVQGVINPS